MYKTGRRAFNACMEMQQVPAAAAPARRTAAGHPARRREAVRAARLPRGDDPRDCRGSRGPVGAGGLLLRPQARAVSCHLRCTGRPPSENGWRCCSKRRSAPGSSDHLRQVVEAFVAAGAAPARQRRRRVLRAAGGARAGAARQRPSVCWSTSSTRWRTASSTHCTPRGPAATGPPPPGPTSSRWVRCCTTSATTACPGFRADATSDNDPAAGALLIDFIVAGLSALLPAPAPRAPERPLQPPPGDKHEPSNLPGHAAGLGPQR